MTDRIKDLFDAYAAGRVSRRDLMRGAARLGITAAGANVLVAGNTVFKSANPKETIRQLRQR